MTSDQRPRLLTHVEALAYVETVSRAQAAEVVRETVTSALLRGDDPDDIDAIVAALRDAHETWIADVLSQMREVLERDFPHGVEPPTCTVTRGSHKRR